ncbi:MAG: FtsX-like permease family protein [Deltaproteobacteria bacterium]|jgi:putative ABC transport system permease protein|nr:FtsX-like permease family protein [Deltaproteobacteria bacterium]
MAGNRSFALRMVLFSLIRRRSRLLVALTGVTIGATVLLGLITLCYDIPRQLGREFRSYGANMVFVDAGVGGRLDLAALGRVRETLPPGRLLGLAPLRYEAVRNNMLPYTAVGTDFSEIQKTSPYWQVEGAWPEAPGQLLIGADVRRATRLENGQRMTLSGRNSNQERYEKDFAVSGTVTTGGVEDGFVYLSLADMETMTREAGVADLAEASLTGGGDVSLEALAAQIKEANPGIEPRLVTRVTRSEETVLSKLTWLVYLVTLVVLSLTMICVTTTMMTVVMERRKEIGLKKALGAENKVVAREFLAEGLMLGVLGGLVGCFTGFVFARVVSSSVFGRGLSPEFHLIPVTVAVSAVVTVLASLWPVRRAVDVEPAHVLRGE